MGTRAQIIIALTVSFNTGTFLTMGLDELVRGHVGSGSFLLGVAAISAAVAALFTTIIFRTLPARA
ncbi:MAG TPA: hypothetical protein VGG01_18810 [Xanthobacteraceae bacterium]|jgi:hypothetical protein